MQKEYLIETRAVTDEKGNLLTLKYYLIEEAASPAASPLYRICVKKGSAGQPGVEETESTPPFSDSEKDARRLLRRLIRNAVTPVCLLEIVDDMMSAPPLPEEVPLHGANPAGEPLLADR